MDLGHDRLMRRTRPLVLVMAVLAVACAEDVQTTNAPVQPNAEGGLQAAGLTASCGGSAFAQLPPDTSALTPFTSFDDLDLSQVGGEGPFFREFASNYDWVVTEEGDGWRQLFGQPVGHRSDPPYAYLRIEKDDGGWAPVGWGQCRIEVDAEGWGNARFVIDPKARPDPETDQISVLATENACAGGGPPDGRQVKPVILSEDAHTISIVILVEPTQGATTCPGNPAFPVEVQLGSAIGDRDILDASVFPPERQWP